MQIKGFLTKEIFRNYQNGYSIFSLKTDDKTITCAGIIQKFPYYTPLCLEGEYGRNSKYPETFIIDSFMGWNTTEQNDILYLANGLDISGLTIKKAEKIIKTLNMPVFEAVKKANSEKEFATKIPNIDQKISHQIYTKIKQTIDFRTLFDEIIHAGGNYSDAIKVFEIYAEKSQEMLLKHPYIVGTLLEWKFDMCDQIAKEHSIKSLSLERAKGICKYVMTQSLNDGNTYVTLEEFSYRANHLLANSPLGTVPISFLLSFLLTEKQYVHHVRKGEMRFALKTVHDNENILVKNISRLSQTSKTYNFDEKAIESIEKETNINFSNEQKKSFDSLKTSGIKIITGGPGCGKTTTIDGLIHYIKEVYKEDVCLCAPTGCAAQHMAEKSGMQASTFHYLLGIRPFDTGCIPDFNSQTQLPYHFFIIDEFSIADIEMTALLFDAIPNDSCIIIVGDPDQLESVGPGNVLEDFITSGLFEVYHLNTIFRQKKGSNIILNAKKAAIGNSEFTEGEDFALKHFDNEMDAVNACISYSLQKEEGECQVLSPMKKEKAGTKYLNKAIQSIRHKGEMGAKVYGDNEFYVNDRIITIKNNRKDNYFNGEPGIVKFIDDEGMLLRFDNGDEIYLKNSALDEVIPSHALTIHKSQGSEYPEVAILLTENAKRMINRKILYTAITRAKEKVSIFYQDGVLGQIPASKKRHTELSDELILLY